LRFVKRVDAVAEQPRPAGTAMLLWECPECTGLETWIVRVKPTGEAAQ
jgi:hypothetical protein